MTVTEKKKEKDLQFEMFESQKMLYTLKLLELVVCRLSVYLENKLHAVAVAANIAKP